jgi:lipid II:glycine glycyltransferase (peptidoglycan interpeptide bridge formation enzyme)
MKLKIKKINDKSKWNKFVSKHDKSSFLQTWQWGDFQEKSLGKEVLRLGLFVQNQLKALNLAVIENSRFGKFIYTPRGPIMDWSSKDVPYYLKAFAKYFDINREFVFYRSDPRLKNGSKNTEFYDKLGFRNAANFVQVQRCWIMDLDKADNEKELFKSAKSQGMSKSLPRHIRKAVKNGVKCRISDNIDDLEKLIEFLNYLAENKNIPKRPDSYYRDMFKHMAPDGLMKLVVAEHKGTPVSILLISTYGDEVATLHGASNPERERNLYASKRVYWDAMLYAMREGFSRFNFWGVLSDEEMKDKSHPSYGYSLFKKRFGGRELHLMDTKDFVYKELRYIPIFLQEKYRKLKYKVD